MSEKRQWESGMRVQDNDRFAPHTITIYHCGSLTRLLQHAETEKKNEEEEEKKKEETKLKHTTTEAHLNHFALSFSALVFFYFFFFFFKITLGACTSAFALNLNAH